MEVARFFKGALSVPDMMLMRFKDIYFWYKLEERKIIEQELLYEMKKNDENIPLPDSNKLRKMVDKEIEKRQKEVEEIYGR